MSQLSFVFSLEVAEIRSANIFVALSSFLVLFNGILATSMPIIWDPFGQFVNPFAAMLYTSSHGSICAFLIGRLLKMGRQCATCRMLAVHAPRRCHSASSHG